MSIIVYGPQGCGKTFHAQKLAEFFGCSQVVDFGEGRRHPIEEGRLYSEFFSSCIGAQIQMMNALIITNLEPPAELVDRANRSRRVYPLAAALGMANAAQEG